MKKPKPVQKPTFNQKDVPTSLVSQDMPRLLNIAPNMLCRWEKKFPDSAKAITGSHPSWRENVPNMKQYCTIEVCLFILRMKNSGSSNNTKIHARAILTALGYYDGKCHIKPDPANETIPSYQNETGQKSRKLKLGLGVGIEEALNRARMVEQYMSFKVQDNIHDPEMYAISLKQWQEALELLRKLEGDALKVMEQQGTLVRLDEAIRIYNKGISSAQSKLRLMINNLAQDLIGLDLVQSKLVLEKAIDRALDGIANVWQDDKSEVEVSEEN